MRTVLIALAPAFAGSVYFFGWISAGIMAVSLLTCILTEWLFVRNTAGKVSEAALVTGALYALTLPPTLPLPIVAVGAIFGMVFGKMAFGGFGANIFNPAMVARAFIYITFPVQMTNRWIPAADFSDFPGGFTAWRYAITGHYPDSITAATLSHVFKAGAETVPSISKLLLGNIQGQFDYLGEMTLIGGGSLGETSAILLMLGGAYLLVQKVAKWRIITAFFMGYLAFQSVLFQLVSGSQVIDPITAVLSGGIILGGFFMVTDPVSATKTSVGQWIYGILIAILACLIRSFSLFAGGLMFAILLGNMFASLIDYLVKSRKSL